jgi:hypothetical protein
LHCHVAAAVPASSISFAEAFDTRILSWTTPPPFNKKLSLHRLRLDQALSILFSFNQSTMTSQEAAADMAVPKNGVDAVKPVMVDAGKQSDAPAPTATATATAGSAGPAPSTTEKAEAAAVTDDHGVNPLEFEGEVDSNHDLPTAETIRNIDNHIVLDRDGKSHTFRSLYTGRHTARRVLIIFIRHFYCGVSQPPPLLLPPPLTKNPRTAKNTSAPSPSP